MQRYGLKLVLVGDSRVGKSQLSRAFVNKNFLDDAQVTVGIEFSTKVIEFEKSLITTHIWDTAGQDRGLSMTKAYFKNTAGAILVYDVCDKRSFENLQTKWLPQLREQGYGDVRVILVGNKVDLVSNGREREVSIEQAVEFARQENMDFFETSALTNQYVEDMFRRISLCVARVLPEVAVHLEVSYLPDGWMACPDESGDPADLSDISVNDVAAALNSGPVNETPSAGTSASSPSSLSKRLSNNATTLSKERTRSPLAPAPDMPRMVYRNYWTGECTKDRPAFPAALSEGQLFCAREAPSTELDPFTGKPVDRALKERTSSCKTTATFVSNASGASGPRTSSTNEPNFDLHESRRTLSKSSSGSGQHSGEDGFLRRIFRCTCTMS